MDDHKMTQGSQPFRFIYFPNKENPKFFINHIFRPLSLCPSQRQSIFRPLYLVRREGHIPKNGVISPSIVGVRSTSIRQYLSNHIYELSTHTQSFSIEKIPFLVPSLVLYKDDTLRKACISTIGQIQRTGYRQY